MKSNTLADTQKSQRIHRLVQEFKTLKWYTLFHVLMLFCLSSGALNFWYRGNDSQFSSIESKPLFGILIVIILASLRVFKKDDMKDLQAFWITRPVRPKILYSMKLVALHLCLTFPAFLVTVVTLLFITNPLHALIYAVEVSLWIGFSIHLLAFGFLSFKGYSLSFLIPFIFFLSMIMTLFIYFDKYRDHWNTQVDSFQITVYLLIILVVWIVLFWLGIRYLINYPHRRIASYNSIFGWCITIISLHFVNIIPNIYDSDKILDAFVPKDPLELKDRSFSSREGEHVVSLHYYLPLPEFEKRDELELESSEKGTLELENGQVLVVWNHLIEKEGEFMLEIQIDVPVDQDYGGFKDLDFASFKKSFNNKVETMRGEISLFRADEKRLFKITDNMHVEPFIHNDVKYSVLSQKGQTDENVGLIQKNQPYLQQESTKRRSTIIVHRFDPPLLFSSLLENSISPYEGYVQTAYYSFFTGERISYAINDHGYAKSLFGHLNSEHVDTTMEKGHDLYALYEHWQRLEDSKKTILSYEEWLEKEIEIGCYTYINGDIITIPFDVKIELPMMPQVFEE